MVNDCGVSYKHGASSLLNAYDIAPILKQTGY